MLLLIETALAVSAVLISLIAPNLGSHWFGELESRFRAVARRKTLSVLIVGFTALAARTALLPILPVPIPQVDDEFSHLLLADTLLHGRLANPTPPMWVHFETLQANMRPAYASVYPPMQGIFLAAGRLLTGKPFAGVLLSVALMCAAICWMLQAWMPAEWAFLGGLLAALRFGMFTYWANGYMGGAPAVIGGALALGALPRIQRDLRARDAVIMGIGFAVAANSRPYEGFVLGLFVASALLYWLCRQRGANLRRAFLHVVAPLVIVVSVAAVSTGYYFWRLTGNPVVTPYQVNWETYGMMPKFLWESQRPRQEATLRHEVLNQFSYVGEYGIYVSTRTVKGVVKAWAVRLEQDWIFYLGPILSLPLLVVAATAPYGFGWKQFDPNTRFLILCAAGVAAGIAAELQSYPHYAAPITCVVLALVLLSMRAIRWRRIRGKPFGLALTRAIALACLIIVGVRVTALPLRLPMKRSFLPSNYETLAGPIPSYTVQARLEAIPGQHLVLVNYPRGSQNWMGWVHNDADIDHSKIVWAWDMGKEKNRALTEYFSARRIWQVDAGENPPALSPYVASSR